MNIDETMSILRIIFENEGIYLQNYSYLSSEWPLHSKQGANLLL